MEQKHFWEIRKTDLFQWLLIILAYEMHDSALYIMYGDYITGIAIGLILLVYARYPSTRNQMLGIGLAFLLIDIIFVRFINSGGIGVDIYLRWASQLMIAFFSVSIDKNSFVDKFTRFVVTMAGISLVLYTISLADTSLIKKMALLSYSPWEGTTHYGGFLYTLTTGYTRNSGVFNEPGLYQIVLNTALFLLVFYEKQIYATEKKRIRMIFILIITILTTQSTTGYVGMLMILTCFLLKKDNNRLYRRLVVVAMIAAIFILVDYSWNEKTSLLYKVLISKIQDINHDTKVDYIVSSGQARLVTIQMCIQSILKYPFGIGIDKYNLILRSSFRYGDAAVAAVLFSTAAQIGVVPVFIIVFSYIKGVWKNRKHFMSFLVAVFLFFNTVLAQSDLFYPAIWVLMFISGERREIDESTMVVQ